MYKLGVRGASSAWFESYLSNRYQVVAIPYLQGNLRKVAQSETKTINLGVTTGSILGPILFLLYINDLPTCFPDFSVYYADDTGFLFPNVIGSSHQQRLNDVLDWFNFNQLSVNASKTALVQFHGRSVANQINLNIEGENLTPLGSTKYLGLFLDSKLSWTVHIERLCAKLSSVCYMLRQLKGKISSEMLLNVYYANFYSRLQYGVEFWGQSPGWGKVFQVQKKAVRILNGQEWGDEGLPVSCRGVFKKFGLLTLPALYIFQTIGVVLRSSIPIFQTVHGHATRHNGNYILPHHGTNRYEKRPAYNGAKLFNNLQRSLKEKVGSKSFKTALKAHLVNEEPYSVPS